MSTFVTAGAPAMAGMAMAVSAYGSAMAGAGAPSAEKDKEKAEVSWRAYEEAGESAGRLVRKAVYGAAKVRVTPHASRSP